MRRHLPILHTGVMAEKSMSPPQSASSKLPPPPPQSAHPSRWCPDCGTIVTEVRCPTCGVLVGGPEAARFWQLHAQIADLTRLRDQALLELRSTRSTGPDDLPPPPPPGAREPSQGWAPNLTVRDLLLTLGVFSLVVAVVSFAVVSWDDLSTTGRVGLVIGVTALVGASGAVLFRKGLTATGEAVTVFWAALLVADVAAGRVLLVPDAPPLTAWAIGLAAVAVLLTGFGSLTSSRTSSALGLAAALVPLPLLAIGQGSEILVAASSLVGFGIAWWATGPLDRRSGRLGTILAASLQHLAWSFAAGAALVGLATNDVVGILVLLAIIGALLTGAHKIEPSGPLLRTRAWMAKSAILVITTPVVLSTRGDDDAWGLLAATLTAVVVLALTERSTRRGRDGATLIGAGTVILFGLLPSAVNLIRSLVTLFEPATDYWTGSAGETLRFSGPWRLSDQLVSLGLLAAVGLATVDQVRSRPHLRWVAGSVIGVVSIIAVPMIVGVPMWIAFALLIAAGITCFSVAVVINRDEPLLAGAVLTASAVGVSLATPAFTIISLAMVSVAFCTLAFHSATSSTSDRAAFFLATSFGTASSMVLAIAANAGWEAGTIALAVELTAAALLLPLPAAAHLAGVADSRLGRLLELPRVQGAYELAGAVVMVAAMCAAAAGDDALFITSALIIGAVASVMQSIRPERSWLVVVAAGLLAGATIVQLDNAGIELVELHAAPVAAAAAVFGWYVHRETPASSSWVTWGPATAIALGPSLSAALGEDPGTRPIILPVVGFAVVALGALLRKQAPTIIGAFVVAAVGIDFLLTLAADLPRWIPFASAGLLLLGLGANFEQSRNRARQFALQIKELS